MWFSGLCSSYLYSRHKANQGLLEQLLRGRRIDTMSHSIPVSSSGRSSGGSSSASRSHSQADKHDRRRRDKDKERVEKERVRKEHARKVLEEQKINKARRKWQKQTEFLCTIKFRNSLPDPPLGPHFLQVPLDLNKYVKYRPTTLEQNCNWKLHYERDLGVPIDVIDPRNYLLPRDPPQLAPADRALLDWKDEDHLSSRDNEDLSTSARRKKVDTSVTWLKKTVYLTNDPFDPVHQFKSEQQAQADKQKELDQEIARGGKQDRKMLIEESFMHANNRKPLVHQDSNKSHLTAEWVMPVLPDVYLWPNTYTTVMFDKDPAEDETVRGSEARKRKRANEALVCNVKRTTFEGNSHEVITGSYLMPREKRSNGAQRQEQDEEDEDDEDAFGYEFVKDYKFNILHYAQTRYDGSPHLLFVIDPETNVASYCKLSAKVDLANLPPEHGQSSTGRGAKVSRRDLSEEEMSNARKKVKGDLQMEGDFITLNNDNVRRRNGPGRGFGDDGGEDDQEEEEEDDDDDEEEEDEAGAAAAGENGHHNATVNGGLSERGEDGRTSSSWNGGTSDADHESVLSMTMESEASNVAVKGTESSEADLIGTHTDDNDSES